MHYPSRETLDRLRELARVDAHGFGDFIRDNSNPNLKTFLQNQWKKHQPHFASPETENPMGVSRGFYQKKLQDFIKQGLPSGWVSACPECGRITDGWCLHAYSVDSQPVPDDQARRLRTTIIATRLSGILGLVEPDDLGPENFQWLKTTYHELTQ